MRFLTIMYTREYISAVFGAVLAQHIVKWRERARSADANRRRLLKGYKVKVAHLL